MLSPMSRSSGVGEIHSCPAFPVSMLLHGPPWSTRTLMTCREAPEQEAARSHWWNESNRGLVATRNEALGCKHRCAMPHEWGRGTRHAFHLVPHRETNEGDASCWKLQTLTILQNECEKAKNKRCKSPNKEQKATNDRSESLLRCVVLCWLELQSGPAGMQNLNKSFTDSSSAKSHRCDDRTRKTKSKRRR